MRWRQLLPGAAGSGARVERARSVGVTVISRQLEQANLVYGVFAVVVVLLGWLYLGSSWSCTRPRSTSSWPDACGFAQPLLQPPLTEPDRQVLTASPGPRSAGPSSGSR